MNMQSLERKLSRYEPCAPPAGLRDEIVSGVLRRERGRRRLGWTLGLVAAMLIISWFLCERADRVYADAQRIVSGEVPAPEYDAHVLAEKATDIRPILSIQLPAARALLQFNGGGHE